MDEETSKLLIIAALLERLGLEQAVITRAEMTKLAGRKLSARWSGDVIHVRLEPGAPKNGRIQ